MKRKRKILLKKRNLLIILLSALLFSFAFSAATVYAFTLGTARKAAPGKFVVDGDYWTYRYKKDNTIARNVYLKIDNKCYYFNSKGHRWCSWHTINGKKCYFGTRSQGYLIRNSVIRYKGDILSVDSLSIKEGETSPPKRYNSGSMILAMENAGQLIEDEELRAQIKSCGIGTSATRAEILKKLFNIKYLSLNKKTQVITPTLLGEMIFDVVNCSIRQLLNPELTASWEKGLNYVAEGSITEQEYMDNLEHFVRLRTKQVEDSNIQPYLRQFFDAAAVNYKDAAAKSGTKTSGRTTSGTGRSRTYRKPSASK